MNPDELARLEDERAFLSRSLTDLDRELAAGDIDALDAATLRTDYARRLAEVERGIQTGHVAIAERARPRRVGRTIVGVVVVAALALGAGLTVASVAGSRKSGGTATGGVGNRNFDGLLSEAASLAQQGKFADALRDYDTVITQDPTNVEALAEKGLLLASLAGPTNSPQFVSEGERFVREAIAASPGEPRPYFYLALILRLRGDEKGAQGAIDQSLAHDPPATLRSQIDQFRSATTTTTTPAAG